MTTIHFHGGPLAGGEQQHEGKPPPYVVVRASSDDGDITVLVGTYRPDPDSAGGRCYDWQAVLLAEFEREVAMLHSLDASGHAYYETAAHHIKAARAALARSRQ